MAVRFAGKERRKFDQVNRMSIPPAFRDGLGQTVYILKSPQDDPCLLIFSIEEWDRFMDMVTDSFDADELIKAERSISDTSEMAAVDKAGRITLKEDYKEFAQLEEDVLVVGANNRVELWLEENWKAASSEKPDFKKMPLTPRRNRG